MSNFLSENVQNVEENYFMRYNVQKYTRGEIDKAGEILGSKRKTLPEFSWAVEVLNNWRSCHGYPINTFNVTLRKKLKSIDKTALVAQRLKRITSIIDKLRRFDKMKLSRMQDIGGLRAVVGNLNQVEELFQNYKSSNFQHTLVNERNYIEKPKESGYRSVHLVYKYYRKEPADYNGLMVELQIRTRLQHAWATAVETMGTFLDYSLKSSEGPDEWLKFFALSSSAFAHIEQTPLVPGYENLSKEETFLKVVEEQKRLQVVDKLSAFSLALNAISSDKRKGSYYLLILDPEKRELNFNVYSRDRLGEATDDYLKAEQVEVQGGQRQVVLVASDSVEALRRAYPNYFLDTHEFLNVLDSIEKEMENVSKDI